MAFTVHHCEQRTAEWYQARLGRLTASDAKEALSVVKSGESAGRKRVRCQLVVERLTGLPTEDGYTNAAMQRGLAFEDEARAAFEAHTGILVEPCGFVAHDELQIGCSPDGVFDDVKAGVEIKVPLPHTHVGYLRGGLKVPSDYLAQLLHSLLVTGAARWHFVSYCPEMPERLRLFHVVLAADEAGLTAHEAAVRAFLAEVDAEEAALRTLADLPTRLRQAVEVSA